MRGMTHRLKRCANCNNWNLITGNCIVLHKKMRAYERCISRWTPIPREHL